MQDLIFYIVIHNIDLILFFEKQKKYEKLRNYKYLLVGNHEQNFTNDKIIQCNKLEDNIESCNNYLAYTAWYIASKIDNNHRYVCLLEYDSELTDSFNYDEFLKQISESDCGIFGFYSLPTTNSFLNNDIFSNRLISFLRERRIKELRVNNKKWIVTNNVVFKRDELINLFNDDLMLDFFEYLKNDKMSGHFLERFLTVYCFYKNIRYDFIEGDMLIHRALDSHNTQNRKFGNEGYEQFKAINKISNS